MFFKKILAIRNSLSFPSEIIEGTRIIFSSSFFDHDRLVQLLIGGGIAVTITYLSHVLNAYRDGLLVNMSYNVMIFSVCKVILMVILEGWLFFIEGARSSQRSVELDNQVMELQFEMLKKQIDSHLL